jgi:hypothetical protein
VGAFGSRKARRPGIRRCLYVRNSWCSSGLIFAVPAVSTHCDDCTRRDHGVASLIHQDEASDTSTTPVVITEQEPVLALAEAPLSGSLPPFVGDPLTIANVTGKAEPGKEEQHVSNRILTKCIAFSDMDNALQTIMAVNAFHETQHPYAPILEVLTYDLGTISTFGTLEDFREEISQLEECVLDPLIPEVKSDNHN